MSALMHRAKKIIAGEIEAQAEEILRLGRNENEDARSQPLYRAGDMLRGFSRSIWNLEAHEIHRALGAPGDWGYDTPMGDALRVLYEEHNRERQAAVENAAPSLENKKVQDELCAVMRRAAERQTEIMIEVIQQALAGGEEE